MKEVKKCSISGIAFTLDTDAYQTLESYLDSLKKTYNDTSDGSEIVADIEARIAELILSTQDNGRVVEKPLIQNIIRQLGTAEDISGEDIDADNDLKNESPRIPRRLYRDTENARLSGVCAGIGKYFDIDPVWIRLGMFLPLLLSAFGWLPFLYWTGPMMGNLFGIFMVCYLIMWFVVPAARSARQKLEMNGERITEQSIRETTTAASDPDSKARPIVAEAVSVFGKIVLILLKIFAGAIVLSLILAACTLIIGLFAVMVGGHEVISPAYLAELPLSIPILGIFIALIPIVLFIYILMCLIASRKPGGKAVLVIFLLWLASIIACACIAVRKNVVETFKSKRNTVEQIMQEEILIDGDTISLEQLLRDFDQESVVDQRADSVHISVPSRSIDITISKGSNARNVKSLTIKQDDDDKVTVTASTGTQQTEQIDL